MSCGSFDEPVQVDRETRQSYAGVTCEERNGFAPSVETRGLDEGSVESEQARRCRDGSDADDAKPGAQREEHGEVPLDQVVSYQPGEAEPSPRRSKRQPTVSPWRSA